MDENTVFIKTPRGAAEIALRQAGLSLGQRRVLIMVDGRRRVADLAVYAPPGELAGVLDLLVDRDLIEPVAPATAPGPLARPTQPAAPTQPRGTRPTRPSGPSTIVPPEGRPTQPTDETRRRAVRGLIDRVGPDGEALAERIERATSSNELLERLREAERMIVGIRGAEAAAEYVRFVRGR